jgi:Domain of unknown function (DUF1963)
MSNQAKARVKESPVGRFARTAFKPVVTPGDPGPMASKYGGVPWLRDGEAWPACPNCKKSMHLVMQLDLATLPAAMREVGDTGLLQFFACTSSKPLCEVDTEAFFPQSGAKKPKAKLARVVRPEGTCGSPAKAPDLDRAPEPKAITGWTACEDFPQSARETDVEVDDAVGEALYDACEGGDKLGGWPKWIQDLEYPSCPDCGEEMKSFVYQLTSDAENGCSYCGDGVAYVCQCPTHRHQIDELAQQ